MISARSACICDSPRLKQFVAATATVLVGLGYAATVCGHHSFDAVFDIDQPIELTGTVTKVEWTNPHVWFFIDVQNDDAETEAWALEMGSPNALIRRGWTYGSLPVGTVVTVQGALARDGSSRAAALVVTLPSGERLFGAQN